MEVCNSSCKGKPTLEKLLGVGWIHWLGLLCKRGNSCHVGPAQKPVLWGNVVQRQLISSLQRQPGLAWPVLDWCEENPAAFFYALPSEGFCQLKHKIMLHGPSKSSLFVSVASLWKTWSVEKCGAEQAAWSCSGQVRSSRACVFWFMASHIPFRLTVLSPVRVSPLPS